MRSPHTTTRKQHPLCATREKSACSKKDPAQSKINKEIRPKLLAFSKEGHMDVPHDTDHFPDPSLIGSPSPPSCLFCGALPVIYDNNSSNINNRNSKYYQGSDIPASVPASILHGSAYLILPRMIPFLKSCCIRRGKRDSVNGRVGPTVVRVGARM